MIKQYISDKNVEEEFLQYAKDFTDKMAELGYPYQGHTTAMEYDDDKIENRNITTLYLYSGYDPTSSHIMELISEYAENAFLDYPTNTIVIRKTESYITVTIFATI